MAVTVAALLGVLAGCLLGVAAVGLSIRRRFGRTPGAFPCKLRVLRADGGRPEWPLRGFGSHWRRRRAGVWVHDVLVVRCGLFGQHAAALPVRIPEDTVRHASPAELRGLGPSPQVVGLRLDGGVLVELATACQTRSLAVGPFLAAAIPGLPPAPTDRPPRRS
jgi:hypothetical protein